MSFLSLIPLPWRIGILSGALLLGVWWVYRSGKEAGKEAQKQESTQETKAQIEEFRKNAEAEYQRLTTLNQEAVAQAQQLNREAQAREAKLLNSLQSLSRERSDNLQALQRVPDSGLHQAVVSTLGIRHVSDTASCYTPAEERKILEAVTDYPPCQKQTQLQSEQIAEIRTQVASLRDEVKAVEQQAQAEKQLRQRYAEFYTTAYNLLRQKKRSGKCLWMFKCGKEPVLSIPKPDLIAAPI